MAIDIETIERTGPVVPVTPAQPQDRTEFNTRRREEESARDEDRFARRDSIEIRGEAGNRPNIELISPEGGLRTTIFDRPDALQSQEDRLRTDERPRDDRVAFAEVAPDEIQAGLDTTGNSQVQDIAARNANDDARDQRINPTTSELVRDTLDQDVGPREPVSLAQRVNQTERLNNPQVDNLNSNLQIDAFDNGRADRLVDTDELARNLNADARRAEDAAEAAAAENRALPAAAEAAIARRASEESEQNVRETAEAETRTEAAVIEASQQATTAANEQADTERTTRLNSQEQETQDTQTAQANAEVTGDGGEINSLSENADTAQVEEQIQEQAEAGQLAGATPLAFTADGSATFADGRGQRVNISA